MSEAASSSPRHDGSLRSRRKAKSDPRVEALQQSLESSCASGKECKRGGGRRIDSSARRVACTHISLQQPRFRKTSFQLLREDTVGKKPWLGGRSEGRGRRGAEWSDRFSRLAATAQLHVSILGRRLPPPVGWLGRLYARKFLGNVDGKYILKTCFQENGDSFPKIQHFSCF